MSLSPMVLNFILMWLLTTSVMSHATNYLLRWSCGLPCLRSLVIGSSWLPSAAMISLEVSLVLVMISSEVSPRPRAGEMRPAPAAGLGW